ncbi:MAG: HAMP domain-containing protein, partial [Halobacteria archaeon]|nr:HAMP domain-containing protein [Halobacteria archaeon]
MLVDPAYTNAEGEEIGAAYVAHGENSNLEFNTSVAGNLNIPSEELSGDNGSFSYTRNGEKWHAEYQRMTLASGVEYYTVAAVPVSQMLSASREIRNQSILIAGGSAFAVLLVGFFMSRRIARPIRNLAEDASEVADGKLDHDIRRSDYSVEMERLTDAACDMKNNVVESLDEAEEAKEEAESQKEEAEKAKREAEEMRHHLEDKAQEYENVMSEVADGDLTLRMDSDSRNDAMNSIA